MATAHRNLLLSRNPGVYSELSKYADAIQQEGQEGKARLSVLDDLRVLRGSIQEVLSRSGSEGEVEPLQEYVQGRLVSMSDKTRLQLLGTLLPKVNKFLLTEERLRRDETISLAQFRVWFSRFWTVLEGLASALDSEQVDSGRELLERFKDSMRDLGDPRQQSTRDDWDDGKYNDV